MLKIILTIIVSIFILLVIDALFIGFVYKLLKIWNPIKSDDLKNNLISERFSAGTFTDIDRAVADNFINYGGKNITLILTPKFLYVRNTLFTYIMRFKIDSIMHYSVKKKFFGHRITLFLSIDGQKNIFYFKTKRENDWIKVLSSLGIKPAGRLPLSEASRCNAQRNEKEV